MLTCRAAPRCCRRLLRNTPPHRLPHRTVASSHDPSTPSPNPNEAALDAHFREAASIAAGNLPSTHTSTSPSKKTPAPDQIPPVRRKRRRRKNEPPGVDPVVANYMRYQHMSATSGKYGSAFTPGYEPHKLLSNPPGPADVTLELLMASQAHMGHSTALWNPANSRYIFGIRSGIHIISLDTTAQYLRRAAKVVSGVAEKGGSILFVGTRPGFDRCVVRAAQLASPAFHLFDHWVPGTITNGQSILGRCGLKVVDEFDAEIDGFEPQLFERQVLKPDLIVCLNPLENGAMLHECALATIPTIGIIDTDADPTWVTYPIPANDDSLRCVQVIAGVLGRAGQEGQRRRRQLALEGKVTYNPPERLELPADFDFDGYKQQREQRKKLFANGLADHLLLTSPALSRAFAQISSEQRNMVEAGDASVFQELSRGIGSAELTALKQHCRVRSQIRDHGEFGSLQGPGLAATMSQSGSAGTAPEGVPPDFPTGTPPMLDTSDRDPRGMDSQTLDMDGTGTQTGVSMETKGDQRGDSIAPDELGEQRVPKASDNDKDTPVTMSELEAKRRAAAEAYFGQGGEAEEKSPTPARAAQAEHTEDTPEARDPDPDSDVVAGLEADTQYIPLDDAIASLRQTAPISDSEVEAIKAKGPLPDEMLASLQERFDEEQLGLLQTAVTQYEYAMGRITRAGETVTGLYDLLLELHPKVSEEEIEALLGDGVTWAQQYAIESMLSRDESTELAAAYRRELERQRDGPLDVDAILACVFSEEEMEGIHEEGGINEDRLQTVKEKFTPKQWAELMSIVQDVPVDDGGRGEGGSVDAYDPEAGSREERRAARESEIAAAGDVGNEVERANEGIGEDEGPEREEVLSAGDNVDSMGYHEEAEGDLPNKDKIQQEKVDVGNLEEGGSDQK